MEIYYSHGVGVSMVKSCKIRYFAHLPNPLNKAPADPRFNLEPGAGARAPSCDRLVRIDARWLLRAPASRPAHFDLLRDIRPRRTISSQATTAWANANPLGTATSDSVSDRHHQYQTSRTAPDSWRYVPAIQSNRRCALSLT